MFNIRKIINNIQDQTKKDGSSSPSKDSSKSQTKDHGAEGFLCPTCMLAFPSPESLQTHYESTHIDGAVASLNTDDDFRYSLMCPACKMRFSNEQHLQSHYNRHHAGDSQKTSINDLQSIKLEVTELKTSLKEEKWHSEELKKEVDRLQTTVMNKDVSDPANQQAEMEMMRQQNKALEESKSLLSSEIILLRQQLTDSNAINSELKLQRERIEQRSASMSAETADVKSQLDEESSNKASLELHIRELQNEIVDLNAKLAFRPSADDVAVLKQELISVQTLMDQMTQKREKEKATLESDLKILNEKYNILFNEKISLQQKVESAPRPEDVDTLKSIINQGSSSTEKLQKDLQKKSDELSDKKVKLIKIEQEYAEIRKSYDESLKANEKLEKLNKDHSDNLQKLQKNLNKDKNQITSLNDAICKKDKEIEIIQQQVGEFEINLKQSRDSNQSNLFEKDQSYNQLKIDHERIQGSHRAKESCIEDLNRELSSLQEHYQEQCTLADEYKGQLREKETYAEDQERLVKTTRNRIEELDAELTSQRETLSRLEAERTELYAKIEAGEGANTAIQQLKQENKTLQEKLQEIHKTNDSQAQQSAKIKDDLHKQLNEVKNNLRSSIDQNSKLKMEIKDNVSKQKTQSDRMVQLENELKTKSELLLAAESSKTSIRVDLENHLTSTKNMLQDRTHELGKAKEKLDSTSMESNAKSEELATLQCKLLELQDKFSDEQNKFTALQATLDEKVEALIAATASSKELKEIIKDKMDFIAKLDKSVTEKDDDYKTLVMQSQDDKSKVDQQLKKLMDEKSASMQKLAELASELKSTQKDLETVKEALKEKVKGHLKEKEEMENMRKSEKIDFEKEKSALQSKIEVMDNKISDLQKCLEEKTVEHERLKVKFNMIDSDINTLTAKINTQEVDLNDKAKELSSLESSNDKSKQQVDEWKHNHSRLSEQLKEAEEKSGQLDDRIRCLVAEMDQLNVSKRNLETEFEKEKLARGQAQGSVIELEENMKMANETLDENRANEEQLNQTIKDLSEINNSLKSSVLELDTDLKETKTNLLQVSNIKGQLEFELSNKREKLIELEESRSSLANAMSELTGKFEKYTKESNEEILNLKDAKQLLLNQRVEVQNKIKKLEDDLSQEKTVLEKSKKLWINEKLKLIQENESMKSALDDKIAAHKVLKQQKEENETKYEMQLGALTENLSIFRADIVSEQQKNERIEKSVDGLTGEKLEMEAKLENAMDEHRALLKRCLASETECEKLRSTTAELRKKYDDSLAAMQDLGRENQTLQMETQKHLTRKWLEDSEVDSCTNCPKIFSVTVRKHHCRNCGKIFCHECSSRQATVASSKKPVRVCDTCFKEVLNH